MKRSAQALIRERFHLADQAMNPPSSSGGILDQLKNAKQRAVGKHHGMKVRDDSGLHQRTKSATARAIKLADAVRIVDGTGEDKLTPLELEVARLRFWWVYTGKLCPTCSGIVMSDEVEMIHQPPFARCEKCKCLFPSEGHDAGLKTVSDSDFIEVAIGEETNAPLVRMTHDGDSFESVAVDLEGGVVEGKSLAQETKARLTPFDVIGRMVGLSERQTMRAVGRLLNKVRNRIAETVEEKQTP